MTDDFVLAHLTDVHLAPVPVFPTRKLASKRGLSLLNWKRKRHRLHLRDVADAIAGDIRAMGPAHVAVTGDLTNFGLEAEYRAGAEWLDRLGPSGQVSFVPGNHDAMVAGALEAGMPHLARWATGDDGGAGFPWLRRRGAVALVGLSTAVPTPPFFAGGQLGSDQIDAAAALLARAGGEGLFRVVLMHHPPTDSCRSRKALADREAFRAMIARVGAELILFGHTHRPELARLDGPVGPVLALGCPSASMRAGGHETPAAWRALRIGREADGWRITLTERGIDAQGQIADRATLAFVIRGELRGAAL